MSRFSYNKIQYRSNCHWCFLAAIQSRFWNAEARPTQIRMTLQPLVNPVRHLMLSLTIEVGFLTANIGYALARTDIAPAMRAELKRLVGES